MDHFWVETLRANMYVTFFSSSALMSTMLQRVAAPLAWVRDLEYDGKVDMQHKWEINIQKPTPSIDPNCTKNGIQMPYRDEQTAI